MKIAYGWISKSGGNPQKSVGMVRPSSGQNKGLYTIEFEEGYFTSPPSIKITSWHANEKQDFLHYVEHDSNSPTTKAYVRISKRGKKDTNNFFVMAVSEDEGSSQPHMNYGVIDKDGKKIAGVGGWKSSKSSAGKYKLSKIPTFKGSYSLHVEAPDDEEAYHSWVHRPNSGAADQILEDQECQPTTTTSDAKFDGRSHLASPFFFAAIGKLKSGSAKPLHVEHGIVKASSNGKIKKEQGSSGWGITRTSKGIYKVAYTTKWKAEPAVFLQIQTAVKSGLPEQRRIRVMGHDSKGCGVEILKQDGSSANLTAVDDSFHIIVIGEKS